jgi:polyhydroxyalkanoate synthase
MTTKEKTGAASASLPSPTELASAWTRIFTNGVQALRATAERNAAKSAPTPYDPHAPARALTEYATALWSNPVQLLGAQQKLLQEWTSLWTTAAARAFAQDQEPFVVPEKGDRRFNDPAWSELPIFDYLKQAYLLTTRQTLDLVASSDLDPEARTRVDFYARQFLNAISPANFAFTNPEAIRKALETGGVSLLSGLANMLADAASPSGLVKRRSEDNFELGVTIAATPGSVIFQNELMQLIQYDPATPDVFKRPLLYVPPLVNKYYVLDLQPATSLVKWLVDQGHSVFVISWVNPGPELGDRGIADYIRLGPIAALDVIEQATGERTADIFGFCMGGTLLAITAAYLTANGQADRLGSLSMIGTLLDFTDTGEWATFYEPSQMDAFERHVQATGVIGADKLQALFSAVRANDLIWSSVVNHYLLDRTAPASDLLYWFADGARIPQAFLLEYGKLLLRGNKLREPGGVTIEGTPIDLAKVEAPALMISLKDDHVSGWEATYAGAKLFGGPTRFLLGGSGHNAGVVNPPAARKHGYWATDDLPETAGQWFAAAEKREGSWWPAWQQWLVGQGDGGRVPARVPGGGKLPILEEAPGSYVRVK